MRRVLALVTVVGVLVSGAVAWGTPISTPMSAVLASTQITVTSSLAPPSMFAGAVEYDRTNIKGDVGGYANTTEVSIALGGGTAKRSFSLDLQAPTNQTFHVGHYYGDDIYGVRGVGTLGEGSQSCKDVAFTIADIASSQKVITRLDVRFQTACVGDSRVATIFGELQLGEPAASTSVTTGTRFIAWPDVPVGVLSPAVVPVWLRNTSATALALGPARLSGPNKTDFGVVADTCTHATLPAHSSCAIAVVFAPRAAGSRRALVTVPIGGVDVSTQLAGVGPAGRTFLRLNSQPGDYVGGGKSYLITDAQHQMIDSAYSADTFGASTHDDVSFWDVDMTDRAGLLHVGTYEANNVDNNGFNFSVTGDGRGCSSSTATVRITQIAYSSDNAPTAFDATFSQTCVDTPHSHLTGEVAFRATNNPSPPSGPFILQTGHNLPAGHSLSNGYDTLYTLAVNAAGRAILTDQNGTTLWATPPGVGTPHDRLTVTTDGTVALVAADGRTLWTTPTLGSGQDDFAVLQSDGNLVLYNSTYQPLWSTNTSVAPMSKGT